MSVINKPNTVVKFPKNVAEFPDGQFFAILVPRSIFIPSDAHGYSSSTEHTWSIMVFETEQEWKNEIVHMKSLKYSEPFKAVKCDPAKITTTITVGVE